MKRAIVVASALLATGVAFASPAGATIEYPRLLVSQHVSSGGSVPEATAIGDLTGDGRKDLAVANGSGGSVGTDDLVFVFPQLVDGTLSDAPFSVTPNAPSDGYELAVGRLNGDGHPDLAVGVPGAGIDLFFGTGSGLPSTPDATVSAAFIHFALGDMNDDGQDDLIYTKAGAPYSVVLRPQLLLGGFGPETVVASHLQTQGLSLGDIDGDGRTDFAADGPANDAAAVFLQDPTLHTFTQFDAPLGGTSVTRSFLADVDGDGKSDLVVRTSGAIASARSIGDGTFDAFASVTGPTFTAEEVGDLNADGTDDLAAFTNGKLRVYSGTSLGLTAPCVFPATGVDGTDAATSIGDLTDDGAADLAAAEGGGQNGGATVFRQLTGSETLPTSLSLTVSSSTIAYGDQVTLAGTLSSPAGGCIPPSSVMIHRSINGGSATVIGTAALDADLSFSIDDTPPVMGTVSYWATWHDVDGHADAMSPTRDVTVGRLTTSLSLATSASIVTFGHDVTLRATLAGSVGSPDVDFYRVIGGRATKIGSPSTDANGLAKLTITPSRNASYQARFAGSAGLYPSSSPKRTVDVRVVVVGSMVKYDAFKRGVAIYDCCKAYYRFLVKPKHPGGIVRVAVQYLAGGTWHKLPSDVDRFKLGRDGTDQIFLHVAGGKGYTFRVRAHFASDGDHLGAWSSYVRFRFR